MRYTKVLAESLGLVIYGTAKVHDEPVHDVFNEAKKILREVKDNPGWLFKMEAEG